MAEQSDGQLNVKVGTTYDNSGLNAATKAINNTVATVKKGSNEISLALANTAKAANAGGTALNKSSKDYTNFGRVLQDLPFGLVGIQNNLTQLIPSVGLLGLGFSALVSALTFAQVGTSAWTRGLGDNKKAVDALTLSGEDYLKTLDQVTQAQISGRQNAQSELTDLKLLFSAYQNANLPLKARKDAYEQIQEKYPAYFKNIQFEEKASKQTKDAYDSLTTSILATARARAASDLITKNETRRFENEQKIIDLQKEEVKLRAQSAKVSKQGIDAVRTSTREAAGLKEAVKSNDIIGKINDNIKAQNNLRTDSNLLTANNLRLEQQVNEQIEKGAKIIGEVGKAQKEVAKVANSNILEGGIFGGTGNGISDGGIDAVLPKIQEVVGGSERALALLRGYYGYTDEEITNFVNNYDGSIAKLLEINQSFEEGIQSLVTSGTIDLLTGLGTALGEAFANGANIFEAAGASILSSIGDIIIKFGSLTVAAGVAATALGKALRNPLNPGNAALAITAGVALIAVGAAVKAFSSNLGGGKYERC